VGQSLGSRALFREAAFQKDSGRMGGFVVPLIRVVIAILDLYWYLVIIQAVISWLIAFNVINTYSRPVAMVLDFLYRITEPVLRPIRQFVPSIGGLDISPVILLLIIWLVEMELTHLAFYLYAY
jgi:YggT family protein